MLSKNLGEICIQKHQVPNVDFFFFITLPNFKNKTNSFKFKFNYKT